MIISVLFTQDSQQPATGLTLSDIDLYLYSRVKTSGAITTVWNGIAPTEEIAKGYYSRRYTDEDLDTYDYFAHAEYTGAVTLDSDYAYMEGPFVPSPGDMWEAATRTLTQSAAQVADVVAGSTISVPFASTWTIELTGIGDISDRVSNGLFFTVKESEFLVDAKAFLQVQEGIGLVAFAGTTTGITPGNASLVVDDEDAGDITITVKVAQTDDITSEVRELYYDVKKILLASVPPPLVEGQFNVVGAVTWATSAT